MTPVLDALFLPSPSPGRVVRFLERHAPALPLAGAGFLLSDADGRGRRLLLASSPGAASALLASHAALLVRAFFPEQEGEGAASLVHLYAEPASDSAAGRWGYTVWQGGEAEPTDSFSEEVPPAADGAGVSRLLRLLSAGRGPGPDGAQGRAVAWARTRGLPIDRAPGVAKRRIPILDYATVAGLDQKGLLVEDSPRLYRFTL